MRDEAAATPFTQAERAIREAFYRKVKRVPNLYLENKIDSSIPPIDFTFPSLLSCPLSSNLESRVTQIGWRMTECSSCFRHSRGATGRIIGCTIEAGSTWPTGMSNDGKRLETCFFVEIALQLDTEHLPTSHNPC